VLNQALLETADLASTIQRRMRVAAERLLELNQLSAQVGPGLRRAACRADEVAVEVASIYGRNGVIARRRRRLANRARHAPGSSSHLR
jgi:hypothetical protein